MYKIAAVGDRNSVYGFASLGLKVFFAEDGAEAKHVIRTLAAEEYAVIYVTEKLISEIPDEIDRFSDKPLPAIIPIPGVAGNTGFGLRNVSRFVEQAVGSDILSD